MKNPFICSNSLKSAWEEESPSEEGNTVSIMVLAPEVGLTGPLERPLVDEFN